MIRRTRTNHPAQSDSYNVGLSLLGRGEFSIIVAKLAQSGDLIPLLQPFAALYVLILPDLRTTAGKRVGIDLHVFRANL
jgi:CPA2 family monovalent cation:H+ antiporter-2